MIRWSLLTVLWLRVRQANVDRQLLNYLTWKWSGWRLLKEIVRPTLRLRAYVTPEMVEKLKSVEHGAEFKDQ